MGHISILFGFINTYRTVFYREEAMEAAEEALSDQGQCIPEGRWKPEC